MGESNILTIVVRPRKSDNKIVQRLRDAARIQRRVAEIIDETATEIEQEDARNSM